MTASVAARAGSVILVLCATLLVSMGGACTDEGRPCYAGDFRRCDCATPGAGGASGYQQCTADGQGYGACDCSGNIPGIPSADSGADTATEAPAEAGLLGFTAPCQKNEDCQSGDCFPFNAKGPHCTKPCTQATDCPPPLTGCSNMGQCKVP